MVDALVRGCPNKSDVAEGFVRLERTDTKVISNTQAIGMPDMLRGKVPNNNEAMNHMYVSISFVTT